MNSAADRVPPIRQDLEFVPQYYRGELCYIVRDQVTDSYYRLRELEYIAIKCFQRGLGVEETRQEIKRLTAAEVDEAEVYKFTNQLQGSDLLKGKGMGDVRRLARHARQRRQRRLRSLLSNYLFVTIPLWDPDRALEKMLPAFRLLIKPVCMLAWLILAGIGMWIIATHFGGLIADTFSLLSGWNLLILSVAIYATTFIHELGHALTCKHLGGRVRTMGPAFLLLQPCMFTDVTDAWLFPSKWDRIKVTGAGVMADILLASAAALVWISSEPGILKQFCYTVMIVRTIYAILFNANPLLRFDGYYILSDLLEIPNMRLKTMQYVGYLFDHYVLGLEAHPPEVPASDKRIYLVYGVARVLYRWVIILAIGFFLLSLFVPLGVMMLVSSFYGMVVRPVWNRGRRFQKQFQAGRVHVRALLVLASICAVLGGLFFIPVDYRVSAPCMVAPRQVRIIRMPADGRVVSVPVREGRFVREGEIVARITNPEMISRAGRLREQIMQREVRARAALATHPADYELERTEKEKLEAELADLEKRMARFTLRAPHDGMVVDLHRSEMAVQASAHTRVPFPPPDELMELSRLEGLRLAEGTGLLAVAVQDRPVLRAFVRQQDVSFLSTGDPLECRLAAEPSRLLRSRIRSLTPVDVKTIKNVGLTLADIGEIPVKDARSGSGKQPLSRLYIAEAEVQEGTTGLTWGLTGKASITYGRGSVGLYFSEKIIRAMRLRLQKI